MQARTAVGGPILIPVGRKKPVCELIQADCKPGTGSKKCLTQTWMFDFWVTCSLGQMSLQL